MLGICSHSQPEKWTQTNKICTSWSLQLQCHRSSKDMPFPALYFLPFIVVRSVPCVQNNNQVLKKDTAIVSHHMNEFHYQSYPGIKTAYFCISIPVGKQEKAAISHILGGASWRHLLVAFGNKDRTRKVLVCSNNSSQLYMIDFEACIACYTVPQPNELCDQIEFC